MLFSIFIQVEVAMVRPLLAIILVTSLIATGTTYAVPTVDDTRGQNAQVIKGQQLASDRKVYRNLKGTGAKGSKQSGNATQSNTNPKPPDVGKGGKPK